MFCSTSICCVSFGEVNHSQQVWPIIKYFSEFTIVNHSQPLWVLQNLVGGFNHPEKYESQLDSISTMISTIWGKKKRHVPNHQPGTTEYTCDSTCSAYPSAELNHRSSFKLPRLEPRLIPPDLRGISLGIQVVFIKVWMICSWSYVGFKDFYSECSGM